jgi:hypothetical protein
MIRTVKLQGAVYTWVDSLSVEQCIERPSKGVVAKFVLSFVAFCLYLAALLVLVLQDTRVSEAHLVGSGLSKAVERFGDIQTLESLATYVDEVLAALVVWPANTYGAEQPVTLPLVMGSHVLVGTLRVVQHRTSEWECTDAMLGSTSVSCMADFDSAQQSREASDSAGLFIGPRTLVTFPYVTETFPCPPGLSCTSGTPSRLRPATIFYPDSGYSIEYFYSSFWINGTRLRQSPLALLKDFIDSKTRHLRLTGVIFNPQLNLFTQFNVHFELPITGGVFPFTTYQYLALIDRGEQTLYTAAEIIVWIYVAATTTFEIFMLTRGCRQKNLCLRCLVRGKGISVTRCLSCSKPLPTNFSQPEECTWCTSTFPALPHRCARARLYDPWVLATLACNLLFLIARLITIAARSEAIDVVRQASEAAARYEFGSDQLSREASVLFAPVAQIGAVANDFLAAVLVIAFVRTYRYIGRFQWSAKFLRVFSSGGMLITSFFVTFAIVFAGFAISFHLLLADGSDRFSSLASSMRTTFFMLIMVIDWGDILDDNVMGWIFVIVYVVFVFSCALVMLNLLISLVTYEYKVSVQQQTTDVEAQSMAQLASPWTNKIATAVGVRAKTSASTPPLPISSQGALSGDVNKPASAASSSDVPQQAGLGRMTAVSDDERVLVADEVAKEDMTAQLVADALRSVSGLSAVIDASQTSALHDEVSEMRTQVQRALAFTRAFTQTSQVARRRAPSRVSLGYDADLPFSTL